MFFNVDKMYICHIKLNNTCMLVIHKYILLITYVVQAIYVVSYNMSLEIIIDLPIGFPINNIISLCRWTQYIVQ